jgi:hypothetical protein
MAKAKEKKPTPRSKLKKPTYEVALAAAKKNLFVTNEEMDSIVKKNGNIRVSTANGDEVFWGVDIGDNQFLFANHCLEFLPNRTWGRVGIHKNRKMDHKATVELLKKSHPAYMEYINSLPKPKKHQTGD